MDRETLHERRRRFTPGIIVLLVWVLIASGLLTGCRSAVVHREIADKKAYDIIREAQIDALGETSPFSIDRPSDLLRRRLMVEQNLPHKSGASLGSDRIEPGKHWPDPEYLKPHESKHSPLSVPADGPLPLSLIHALQIGARNGFVYQTRKEDIFRAALDLDLARDEFRRSFASQVEHLRSTDKSRSDEVRGHVTNVGLDLSRALKGGASLTAAIAVDLANLLTMGGASSLGLVGDASISIPLMRGAGRHIAAEPLTQAERNVRYAMFTFERYKRTFAVRIASDYLAVLQQQDTIENTEENYRSLIASAKRARRRADAGRQTEIQVDQAVQDELRARDNWIRATQSYKRRIDAFKILLGLPSDAEIELSRSEMDRLRKTYGDRFSADETDGIFQPDDGQEPLIDEVIELIPPDRKRAGPLEIDPKAAIDIGLENRLDLRTAYDRVSDSQRRIVLLADRLGAELSFLGSATFREGRSIASAGMDDATLNSSRGIYTGLLTLDLPFNRISERNAYRKGLIDMERALRDAQQLEDQIKLDIRNGLRDLLESREGLGIQTRAVGLAEKRTPMTKLLLEAGRAEIRDLLEAQSALLAAQNALTAAVVNYRVAELNLQSDMGVLMVNAQGIWQEYLPKETNHVEK
ncbi:MAG: TolC family protein [Desulfobacterales bacterium]